MEGEVKEGRFNSAFEEECGGSHGNEEVKPGGQGVRSDPGW